MNDQQREVSREPQRRCRFSRRGLLCATAGCALLFATTAAFGLGGAQFFFLAAGICYMSAGILGERLDWFVFGVVVSLTMFLLLVRLS